MSAEFATMLKVFIYIFSLFTIIYNLFNFVQDTLGKMKDRIEKVQWDSDADSNTIKRLKEFGGLQQ